MGYFEISGFCIQTINRASSKFKSLIPLVKPCPHNKFLKEPFITCKVTVNTKKIMHLKHKLLLEIITHHNITSWSKLGFYILFNSQGHIGTGSQHCHLWDSNPHRVDSL